LSFYKKALLTIKQLSLKNNRIGLKNDIFAIALEKQFIGFCQNRQAYSHKLKHYYHQK